MCTFPFNTEAEKNLCYVHAFELVSFLYLTKLSWKQGLTNSLLQLFSKTRNPHLLKTGLLKKNQLLTTSSEGLYLLTLISSWGELP